MFLLDAFLCHNLYPLQHWTQRRGVLLEALFKISEGYFFGPHHLIMVTLLYFEEKVHKKKLQRADVISLLFPRLLCQILEHLGYPFDPQLERKRICRELFTLDKWNNMTAYRVDQPERPQPATRRASPRHIPKGIPIAAPAIPELHQLLQPHLSHPLQLNQGWLFPFLNTESYVVHWRPSQHLRAVLFKRCWPLRLNTLPS